MTGCPTCDAAVEPKSLIEGEIFPCRDCGTELEVVSLAPFTVQPAPKEAEDWGE